jgi:2-keto-4-pentenoate hydratase/2-oxohepta-3-ene-1,7-dioic acid hydratase in catechol pathway
MVIGSVKRFAPADKVGSLDLTVDKIICVGKNYIEHATELGDAVPSEPTYFIKPPSTLFDADSGPAVTFPAHFELHHEVELVLRVGHRNGQWTFTHYTVGLDLTLRDLQAKLKKAGLPWEKAKVFSNAAVVGEFHAVDDLSDLLEQPFSLEVNGTMRQRGLGRDMRWSPTDILADLPRWFPLVEGDLLFTGTPAGVGPLAHGDALRVNGHHVEYTLDVLRA